MKQQAHMSQAGKPSIEQVWPLALLLVLICTLLVLSHGRIWQRSPGPAGAPRAGAQLTSMLGCQQTG